MTKDELIKAMKYFPDDAEVRLGVRKSEAMFSIGGVYHYKDPSFIFLEPDVYLDDI